MRNKWKRSRKKPYTEAGIQRLACIRCGNQAKFQWQICADGNNYRPLCAACDVALNRMVLEWAGHPNVDSVMEEYANGKLTLPPVVVYKTPRLLLTNKRRLIHSGKCKWCDIPITWSVGRTKKFCCALHGIRYRRMQDASRP